MVAAARSSETRLLVVLLALVAFFTFWVIPASVEDPEGFGYADGLAPSFSIYLVATLAAATLLGRLVRMFMGKKKAAPGDNASPSEPPEVIEEATDSRSRSWTIIFACVTFAFLLVPYFGFYISSFVFVIFLATTMGERRLMVLTCLPVLLIAGIYAGFELGFTIFLPRGEFVLQLFDVFGD